MKTDKKLDISNMEYLYFFTTLLGKYEKSKYRSVVRTKYYAAESNSDYARFDILAPLFYSFNRQIINDRYGELKNEVLVSIENNFPFESIELIDYIFMDFNSSIKESISNVFSIFYNPYNEILKKSKKYQSKCNYYEFSLLENSINNNPIIQFLEKHSKGDDNINKETEKVDLLRVLLGLEIISKNEITEDIVDKTILLLEGLIKNDNGIILSSIKSAIIQLDGKLTVKGNRSDKKGNSIKVNINSTFTGSNGLKGLGIEDNKLNVLLRKIDIEKYSINDDEYYEEQKQSAIFYNIVNVINEWLKDNYLNE